MAEVFNREKFVKEFNDYCFEVVYRKKKKIGLREYANEIGVSAPTLSRLSQGKPIDLITFIKVCKWMNKSLDDYQL